MIKQIKTILTEYGIAWAINRSLYSLKLKMMTLCPLSERLYEKKTVYPQRLDLFQIDINELRKFLQCLDIVDRNQIINTADKACEGIIKGFSSIDLEYGHPLDWQLNPLTHRRCDENQKWYRIPDFDSERGDIKAIWEASRFSHFITLARAYLLTQDNKYYLAFAEQLLSWLNDNHYSYGANFKCGQECSFRMVNALLAYTVFKNAGVATDEDAKNVKDLIDRCYRKVLSNFFYAYRCIKNNHTISELMGMITGAWCCGDQKRLGKAFAMLDTVIDEQFTSDGGYKQFSFNYQRLALQDLECVLSIEDKTGIHLKSKDKINKAAMLMYQCQDETGDMPNYGSNDGALIFPVSSCDYRDFSPTINTIHALTTGKQLYKDGKHQEELIWFGNGEEYSRKIIPRKSSQFPEAGLFTIRDERVWSMIVLNEYHSRPAHFDQLHFDLWVDGVNVLCDSGTYSYASETGKELIRTSSHNTVKIDGKEQMKQHGAFLIYDWTKRKIKRASEMLFEGQMFSASGYSHIRKVSYTHNLYQIIDEINIVNDYQILFHTPCQVELIDNKAVLSFEGKVICDIISDEHIQVFESVQSLYYLKKKNINCICVKNCKKQESIIKIHIKGEKNND